VFLIFWITYPSNKQTGTVNNIAKNIAIIRNTHSEKSHSNIERQFAPPILKSSAGQIIF
jgi:hypothetical protein